MNLQPPLSLRTALLKKSRFAFSAESSGEHTPSVCVPDYPSQQYVGGGYKAKYTCPTCGRAAWQNRNFLGKRKLVCNGAEFTKEA